MSPVRAWVPTSRMPSRRPRFLYSFRLGLSVRSRGSVLGARCPANEMSSHEHDPCVPLEMARAERMQGWLGKGCV